MKKIVIVGGGLSGLTAGIYALSNGFQTEIFEKHSILGGECTGWRRDGIYIDGCIHWLMSSSKRRNFYPIFNKIDFLNDDVNLITPDTFGTFEIDGKKVVFYNDIDKLENELISNFPLDKKQIKKMIKHTKQMSKAFVPNILPLDMYMLKDYIKLAWQIRHAIPALIYFRNIKISQYVKRFKSPILQKIIKGVIGEKNNATDLFFTIAEHTTKDCGFPEGGSFKAAMRTRQRFLDLGGIIHTNSEVEKIIIEDNTAKGIILKNGQHIFADYIISATDAYHAFSKLIGIKYTPKCFKKRFEDPDRYNSSSCMLVSYKKPVSIELPRRTYFTCPEFLICGKNRNLLNVYDYAFDSSLNSDYSVVSVLVDCDSKDYKYLKKLSNKEYENEKNRIANDIKNRIEQHFNIKDKLQLLDMTTPLTYERYLNAKDGCYMAFPGSNENGSVMAKNYIKGIKNLILSGQWLQSPGGIPVAIMSGRQSIQRICKWEKKNYRFL